LSERPRQDAAFLRGAQEYVERIGDEAKDHLFRKPFPEPFDEAYDALNLLRALALPPGARVLEVGSGPGWLTEWLLGLGYRVEAVEPCADMNRIARERVADFARCRRLPVANNVAFHCTTLEDCDLPDASCDAVVFFESLHHVIDEDRCLAQCFRFLKPDGVLGVGGEPAWHPGNRDSEEFWEREMHRFGALENPFTREYLHYLLCKHGFGDVVWHHAVNGLFPTALERLSIRKAATRLAENLHCVVARKPGGHPRTTDLNRPTRAAIAILEADLAEERTARLKVRLSNRGETAWPHAAAMLGQVTLGLFQGRPYGLGRRIFGCREATPRIPLPRTVAPGEELVLDAEFLLPDDFRGRPWKLDLVAERLFWFAARGATAAEVRF
jgi:SAM-dependent methyltransferase